MKTRIIITVFLSGLFFIAKAQNPTVGLIHHDTGSTDDGYLLFSPIPSYKTYLIDKCGREVFNCTSNYKPGFSVYLLPDGNLLRAGKTNNPFFNNGGSGGIIEKIDWNNNVVWSYIISDSNQCQHHDIKALPNGNILAISWDRKTYSEAVAAGRNPAFLSNYFWSEKILELQPIGTDSANIVWEWHSWDHIVQEFDSTKNNYGQIASYPQLVNINYPPNSVFAEWMHMNSVAYNPVLDQIIVCSLFFSELWVIDHSTTTAQAAGHIGGNSGKGGDLLYRWGNPAAYHHGTISDKKFFRVHNAHWIENGFPYANNIMVFNNGTGRPDGNYSSVEILSPPVDSLGNYSNTLPYGPDSVFWKYTAPIPSDFYSPTISGAQQLQNGNVLICSGTKGDFFEINSTKTKVWEYISPVSLDTIFSQGDIPSNNNVFRCTFYPSSYSGFSGQTLTAGLPIELNPWPDSCNLFITIPEFETGKDIAVFPNPATGKFQVQSLKFKVQLVEVYNVLGGKVFSSSMTNQKTYASTSLSMTVDLSDQPSGIYFLKIKTDKFVSSQKIILQK